MLFRPRRSVAASSSSTRLFGECHRYLTSLRGKDFITIGQLSAEELNGLLDRAEYYKKLYKDDQNYSHRPMQGKNIGMIFQKRSTRTRISTEVGMTKLGGHALFLSVDDIQLGTNETILDSAKVLSRFNSLLLARVFRHQDVVDLARHSSIPVINGLSDKHHPLQTLADYMTVREHFGSLKGLTLGWVGDGNNIIHDLMLGAPKLGVNVRIATPNGYECDREVVQTTQELCATHGTSLLLTTDPTHAVEGANIVATDTWVSMGQEDEYKKRVADFDGYQVTMELCKSAASNWTFLHCLPRHSEEVDDQVFYSDRSLVFDEAENRMWTVMAVISAVMGKS